MVSARRAFCDYVAGKSGEGHREEFHGKSTPDSRFVGDDSFVDEFLGLEETRP